MLKLSLKPGEFLNIGENIRVVFSGGSANNIHLLIDAPREMNIKRNKADSNGYHAEDEISKEAREQIVEILRKEKKRKRGNNAELT